ncbi:hypothetical protein PRN20_18115 [Devosia sp. ZB163]|uniref:hypothetical protein n=1 Tax=Devosia sp. ZB163 TaxID=3025938 RepID=UPI00235E5665|nr:hypothetical protein [Devosia sp. ZB163]MDC9825653.1 hypothetical protein [Devosia sp. ZB163]
MLSSAQLKQITTEARPIIERQLEDAERLAGLRDVVAAAGGDWGQLKALIKAQIRDEQDEAGEGKHVRKILDKADYANAYAGMLGLANMNEKNFSDDTPHDADGVVIEDDNLIPAFLSPAQPNGADPRTPVGAAVVGETANHSEVAGELVAPGLTAADHGTDGGVSADDLSAGGENVADRPVHVPEEPGPGSTSVNPPAEGGTNSASISEPVTVPPPHTVTATGDDSAAPPSAAVVVPELASVDADAGVDRSGSHRAPAPVANVVALRSHDPATHFLSEKGLARLHGCLKPEICASSSPRTKLCFDCSRQHDGPTAQMGSAS